MWIKQALSQYWCKIGVAGLGLNLLSKYENNPLEGRSVTHLQPMLCKMDDNVVKARGSRPENKLGNKKRMRKISRYSNLFKLGNK